jgi:uncharacterized spore protein YtfJ
MVHLDSNTHLYEKLLDFAPQVVEKIQQMIGNNNTGSMNPNGSTTTTTYNQQPPL